MNHPGFVTERHRALWSKAAKYTEPATDPNDGKATPRAIHRRPAKVEAVAVEEEAPEMVQAVR